MSNPKPASANVKFPGQAAGRLIGGNLESVATSIGVRMLSMKGAILFLEHNKSGGLGKIDRYLTQLLRSDALDGIVGVVQLATNPEEKTLPLNKLHVTNHLPVETCHAINDLLSC